MLRRARAEGKRVKLVGGGHSWSPIACTEGYHISLDRLSRVLSVDPKSQLVTVEAGIRIWQLLRALHAQGLTLPVIGSITQQSIGGALATATHGSAPDLGSLSTRVVGLRMVLASGDVLSATESSDPTLLAAAQVHLGALGVLTQVTLRTVPLFYLREAAQPLPFDEVIHTLPQLVQSAPYVKLWWMPHTDQVQVYRCQPTTERRELNPIPTWLDEHLINRHLFPGILRATSRYPAAIPTVNRLISRAYFRPRQRHGRNTDILPVPMPPKHEEIEYAIPIERTATALSELRQLIERQRLRVNFPMELRFVAPDEAWLSPMYRRAACCLGVYIGPQLSSLRDRYFQAAESLLQSLGGRPHWGKQFTATRTYLRSVYPAHDRFVALREALDPQRLFQNDFLQHVLGD